MVGSEDSDPSRLSASTRPMEEQLPKEIVQSRARSKHLPVSQSATRKQLEHIYCKCMSPRGEKKEQHRPYLLITSSERHTAQ